MLGAGVAGDRRWKMRGEPGVLDHVRPCSLRYRPMSRSRRTPRLYNKDGHGQTCRKRRGDTMTDGNPGADWSDATRVFDEHRDLLFAVAYRVLGSVTDADDVVQEAWLRWVNARPSEVADSRAFLVRVSTRLAVDRLRRVKARRESYVGPGCRSPCLPATMLRRTSPLPSRS